MSDNYIRSPLAYQGSKFKLLHEIIPILSKFDKVHDVFGGSGTIAVNLPDSRVFYNDFDDRIVNILKSIAAFPKANDAILKYNKIVRKNKLSRTDQEAFLKFREYVNVEQDPFDVWVLSKHSFCSLIRFSQTKGNFNYGFGKRSLDLHYNDPWFHTVHSRLQNIKMHSMTYLDYVKHYHKKACKRTVFYFDPPYLASGDNVYKGKWCESDEIKFLEMLDYLDSLNVKWVLSNVLAHRGLVNKILKKWQKKYNVTYPAFRTSGEAYTINRVYEAIKNETVEVLIKNF